MERLLIWCFICCWNCTEKEINVNNIKAFTIFLILNFMLGVWCNIFFFYNSILILGMLILAIKESLHFFHTQLPMTITSNGISSPIYHPLLSSISTIPFLSHFFVDQDCFISFQPSNLICKVFVRIVSLFHGLRNYGGNFSLIYISFTPLSNLKTHKGWN